MKRVLLLSLLAVCCWSYAEAQISNNLGDVIFQQSEIEYNYLLSGSTTGFIKSFDLFLSNKKLREIPCESQQSANSLSGTDNSSDTIQKDWGNKALISFTGENESINAGQTGTKASLDTY